MESPAALIKEATAASRQLQADAFGIILPDVEKVVTWVQDNGGEVSTTPAVVTAATHRAEPPQSPDTAVGHYPVSAA